jgi:phage terminase small subunit
MHGRSRLRMPASWSSTWLAAAGTATAKAFKWQRTVAEYNAEREKWQLRWRTGERPTSRSTRRAVSASIRALSRIPNVPECFGKGNGRPHINDTRKLSVAAAALYAGVKIDEGGHGAEDALEARCAREGVSSILGAYEKDNTQKVDPISSLLATLAKSSIPGGEGARR